MQTNFFAQIITHILQNFIPQRVIVISEIQSRALPVQVSSNPQMENALRISCIPHAVYTQMNYPYKKGEVIL